MAKLPTDLSGREVASALRRVGFELRRQNGSHMIYGRLAPAARVSIPDHDTVRIGTLRQIISDAG